MVDYSPLWKTMEKKGISQYYLMKKGGIDNKTIYNIKRNENITLLTLERLCVALDCTPERGDFFSSIISSNKSSRRDFYQSYDFTLDKNIGPEIVFRFGPSILP